MQNKHFALQSMHCITIFKEALKMNNKCQWENETKNFKTVNLKEKMTMLNSSNSSKDLEIYISGQNEK